MKNIKIIFLFITLFLISFNNVNAQNTQPTPYQKRQLELSKKWFQILSGQKMSMADEVFYQQITAGKEANEFVLGLAIFNYAATHSKSDCEKIFKQLGADFKQAEKLKNSTDIFLENQLKERAEYARKQKIIQEQEEAYSKTDIGIIKKNIKFAFAQWNKRGEFEKETDYENRLYEQSKKAFDEICLQAIENQINKNNFHLYKELSTYNSDNEYFTVTFKINGIEWQNKINIPIEQAQKFKENWNDLDFKIDDYDWSFANNRLCPTLVILENRYEKKMYKFPTSILNQSEISFKFNDFDIENNYLEGRYFNFSDSVKQLLENKRLDSLELVAFNQRLDSIYVDYNNKLLQNPYNLNKKLISNYNKITESDTQNRVKVFSKEASFLKSEFENLNNSFERFRQNKYEENSNLFSNQIEFNEFYVKGNDIFKDEVERRKVSKYLVENSKFIESMDFQKIKTEPIGSKIGKGLLTAITGVRVSSNNYNAENEERKNIMSVINGCKNKSYYLQILDLLFQLNKDLNREWNKNGKYFENKKDLYTSYISYDYKKILKDKKKD